MSVVDKISKSTPGFEQVRLGPHTPISPGPEHRCEAVGKCRPGPDPGLLAGAEGPRQLRAFYSHWIGLIKGCSHEHTNSMQVSTALVGTVFQSESGKAN